MLDQETLRFMDLSNSIVQYERLRRKKGNGLKPDYRKVEKIRCMKSAKYTFDIKRRHRKAVQQIIIFNIKIK